MRSRRSNRVCLSILPGLLVGLGLLPLGMFTGCSSGSSGGGGGTPPPPSTTITSVSVSCSPTSVTTSGTATCTATVTGTGSYSSAVTWSANAGTITSSGSFTAPAAAGSVTVTATSTQDPTKSGTAAITVTAPVTVSISPTSTTAASGSTVQFTATVTGNSNTSVTWSASAGTISSSGLLSLAGVAAGTNVTVTATSVADSTKSASASVAVTQRVITLTTNGQFVSTPSEGIGSIFGDVIYATGIEVGDIITATQFGKSQTETVDTATVTDGGFYLQLNFSTAFFMPNWVEVTVSSADGTIQSNQLWVAITNDQNVLAMSTDGSTVYGVSGQPFPIQQYASTDGTNKGTLNPNPLTVGYNFSIAVDNKTGWLVSSYSSSYVAVYGAYGNGGEPVTISMPNKIMAIATLDGYGYATEPSNGALEQFNVSQLTPITSVPAGNEPWTMDAATVNGADAIVVYSNEDTTLWLFNNQLAQVDKLVLTGITKASDVSKATLGVGGGWQVQLFGSGPSAGSGAFLSVYDKSLIFWSVDSTNTMQVANQETLSGTPFLIAKDETHGAIIVASLDLTKGTTSMQSINMKTYQATNLTSPSTLPVGFMPGGILVSPDGSKIYAVGILNGQPAFYVLQNQ